MGVGVSTDTGLGDAVINTADTLAAVVVGVGDGVKSDCDGLAGVSVGIGVTMVVLVLSHVPGTLVSLPLSTLMQYGSPVASSYVVTPFLVSTVWNTPFMVWMSPFWNTISNVSRNHATMPSMMELISGRPVDVIVVLPLLLANAAS